MKSVIPFSDNNFGTNILDLSELTEVQYKKYLKSISASIPESAVGYASNYIEIRKLENGNNIYIKIDKDIKTHLIYFDSRRNEVIGDHPVSSEIQELMDIPNAKFVVVIFKDKTAFDLLPYYKKYISLIAVNFIDTSYNWTGAFTDQTSLLQTDSNGKPIKNVDIIEGSHLRLSPPTYFVSEQDTYHRLCGISIDGSAYGIYHKISEVSFEHNKILQDISITYSTAAGLRILSHICKLPLLRSLKLDQQYLSGSYDAEDVLKFSDTLTDLYLKNIKIKCLDLSNLNLTKLKLINCEADKIILPSIKGKNAIGFARTDIPDNDYIIISSNATNVYVCYDANGVYPISENMGDVNIPLNGKSLYFLKSGNINFINTGIINIYNSGVRQIRPVNIAGKSISYMYSNKAPGPEDSIHVQRSVTSDGYKMGNYIVPKYYYDIQSREYMCNKVFKSTKTAYKSLVIIDTYTSQIDLAIEPSGNNIQNIKLGGSVANDCAITILGTNAAASGHNYRANIDISYKNFAITLFRLDLRKINIKFTKPARIFPGWFSLSATEIADSISFKNIEFIQKIRIAGCVFTNGMNSIYDIVSNVKSINAFNIIDSIFKDTDGNTIKAILPDQMFKAPLFINLTELMLYNLNLDLPVLDLSDNLKLSTIDLRLIKIHILKLPNNNYTYNINNLGIGTGGGQWFLDAGYTMPYTNNTIVAQGQTLYNNVQ